MKRKMQNIFVLLGGLGLLTTNSILVEAFACADGSDGRCCKENNILVKLGGKMVIVKNSTSRSLEYDLPGVFTCAGKKDNMVEFCAYLKLSEDGPKAPETSNMTDNNVNSEKPNEPKTCTNNSKKCNNKLKKCKNKLEKCKNKGNNVHVKKDNMESSEENSEENSEEGNEESNEDDDLQGIEVGYTPCAQNITQSKQPGCFIGFICLFITPLLCLTCLLIITLICLTCLLICSIICLLIITLVCLPVYPLRSLNVASI
ncbi:hypothetical protein GQ53DRAFT_770122 [Thozetella sp. PMI_491]|nr:hypothetical protein GQ53DRAFT_770122 [Thozetella sp. PMI_491]